MQKHLESRLTRWLSDEDIATLVFVAQAWGLAALFCFTAYAAFAIFG